MFSGLSVSVLLRIDSVSPSLVVQSGAALLIIGCFTLSHAECIAYSCCVAVSSKEFRRVAPSNDELCYNAFVGNLSAPSCHWHAVSGTVRLQLSAGTVFLADILISKNRASNTFSMLPASNAFSMCFIDSSQDLLRERFICALIKSMLIVNRHPLYRYRRF